MVPTSDSLEAWIDYAERCLYALAHDLRRVPFVDGTRRMHLRALELKRAIARWREECPSVEARAAALDEVEQLARAVRSYVEHRGGGGANACSWNSRRHMLASSADGG